MTHVGKNDNQYFGVGGSKHKEGADIDKSVEYKHGPCGCGFWVNDNSFFRLELFGMGCFLTLLIKDCRRDVGLENSSAKRKEDKTEGKWRRGICWPFLKRGGMAPMT
jgi:hypothetical protein